MAKPNVCLLFGRRLRRLRDEAGLTQDEVASAAKIDTSYYASVERGERNVCLQNLCRIAEALGVSKARLFLAWR